MCKYVVSNCVIINSVFGGCFKRQHCFTLVIQNFCTCSQVNMNEEIPYSITSNFFVSESRKVFFVYEITTESCKLARFVKYSTYFDLVFTILIYKNPFHLLLS